MITYAPIKKVDSETVRQVSDLMSQFAGAPKKVPAKTLQEMISDSNVVLMAVKDGKKIIGMGTFVFVRTPGGFHGRIEYVVIDEKYRGKGLGKTLTEKLIALARKKKAEYIELSSRPERVAANKLYQSMGFTQKETNVYRLRL